MKRRRVGGAMSLMLLSLAACLLPVASTHVDASVAPLPRRVLFVGNSFTYYNNSLHNHYRQLVSAAHGSEWQNVARAMTISGARMAEHREGLQQRLADQQFDAVVLQGHSSEPLNANGSFAEAATEYVEWIRAAKARPVLFMTWAYEGRPAMTEPLATAYESLGQKADALVVPVGRAFARVTAERPDLLLRIADGKHPTVAGTYLAACTMFGALHAQSPVGLAYDAGLPETDASYLQQAAWSVLQDHLAR